MPNGSGELVELRPNPGCALIGHNRLGSLAAKHQLDVVVVVGVGRAQGSDERQGVITAAQRKSGGDSAEGHGAGFKPEVDLEQIRLSLRVNMRRSLADQPERLIDFMHGFVQAEAAAEIGRAHV